MDEPFHPHVIHVAFGLYLILLRKLVVGVMVPQPSTGSEPLPRILKTGEKIPYGVAIVFGGAILGLELPTLGLYL